MIRFIVARHVIVILNQVTRLPHGMPTVLGKCPQFKTIVQSHYVVAVFRDKTKKLVEHNLLDFGVSVFVEVDNFWTFQFGF